MTRRRRCNAAGKQSRAATVRIRAVLLRRGNGRVGLWDGETDEHGRETWKFVPEGAARHLGGDVWELPERLAHEQGFMDG
jgi:hypothetical protein